MMLSFTSNGWKDYNYWQKTNKTILIRLNLLIKYCLRNPFEGNGKPEPLKVSLSGYWSRILYSEHRLLYKFETDNLYILQCRYHY